MAQKVLAGRASDPSKLAATSPELVEVRVDQIVLARSPARAVGEGVSAGMKKVGVEVAVAYATRAVSSRADGAEPSGDAGVPAEALAAGVLLARAGAGFACPVHLERFASPARLCVTDDPRLAGTGGAGMLTLVVPPSQLGRALATGTALVRPPRSVQVLLAGRMRPFVCARDVALELIRRGLDEAVRKVEDEHRAPVVVEFGGPGARLLSVGERAILCGVAPRVGAAAAVFVSDERTEVFLRDQRRSKAYRALVPDPGSSPQAVVNVDLGAIDPLVLDDAGAVRPARDLAGKPVSQVILGGDGATLRDMFAVAALLKSKRVPSRVEWLVAMPSRQMLESLAGEGALADLLATGARLVEPDARVFSGDLYGPPGAGASVRSFEPDPALRGCVVASAETLAYAVAHGVMGDPRSFKRPVRVTVPRVLPTDDVLVVREKKGEGTDAKRAAPIAPAAAPAWKNGALEVVEPGRAFAAPGPVAVFCPAVDDVRHVALRAQESGGDIRAVLSPFIPSSLVAVLSGAGALAIRVENAPKDLVGKKIDLPAPNQWPEKGSASLAVVQGSGAKLQLEWLATSTERSWVTRTISRKA